MGLTERLRDRLSDRETATCAYCGLTLGEDRPNCPACGYTPETSD